MDCICSNDNGIVKGVVMSMKLHILSAGPLTTVQDLGRFGYMDCGMTTSGVMDRSAYAQANELVGNVHGEAVLEFTLAGPKIRIEGEGLIAIAGAEMTASLDGRTLDRGRVYAVRDGQVLEFGMAVQGLRGYLACAGGIDVPKIMGSRSTNLKCGLGGYQGRKLASGDVLDCGSVHLPPWRFRKLCRRSIPMPSYEDHIQVEVILGPQEDHFTKQGIRDFLGEEYTVSPQSDRMGLRLAGAAIEGTGPMDIISDGITFGSVQVTSQGLPIVLMADHQTTGGYAKIATVVSGDLPALAQARPGTKIQFYTGQRV